MTIIQNYFEKDPDEQLDYKFEWAAKTSGSLTDPDVSDWLQSGETIDSYTIGTAFGPSTGSSGSLISVVSDSLSDSNTSVIVWLSGGDLHSEYVVTCHIVTSSSPIARKADRSMKVKIIEK